MTSVTRYTRRTLPNELADYETWATFDATCLSTDDRALYERRMHALRAYLDGTLTETIEHTYGIQSGELLRYLNRCVAHMGDGHIAGWAGLVKGFRTTAPIRRSPVTTRPMFSLGGYTGALQALLAAHPEIRASLDRYLATGVDPKGKHRGRVTKQVTHQIFLQLCADAAVGAQAWPFCVQRKGRNSISEYADKFFITNHDAVALLQYGEESRRRSKRGADDIRSPDATGPFEIVEADEHTADIIFSVGIVTPKGTKYVPCHRLTLIIVVDRFTSYILAWHVVLRRQPSSADVRHCVSNAITGQCLSDELISCLCASIGADDGRDNFRVGFGSLFVDNALSHLSDSLCERVRAESGAAVSFGAIRQPKRRALVERVFGWAAREVFHRSPATTGNSPVDTRRDRPEQKAVKQKVTWQEVMQAIAAAVDRWNLRSTEANYACSPTAQMLDCYAPGSGCLAPIAPPRPSLLPSLRLDVQKVRVCGSRAKGRSPRVSYENAEYTSPALAARWDLIQQKIVLHADPDDVSQVQAYTLAGMAIGALTPVSSRWRFPHSVQMRRLLKSKVKAGHDELGVDPTGLVLSDLAQQALDACSKTPRSTQAATIVAEEARKGYSTDLSAKGQAKTPTTKSLASRVRTDRAIDFTLVAK